MVMGFWEIFYVNLVGVSISTFFILLSYVVLFGRKPYQARERRWKILAVTVVFIAALAFLGAVFYKTGLLSRKYHIGTTLFSYLGIFGSACYLWFLHKESFWVSWVSAAFFQIIEELACSFAFFFSRTEEFHLELIYERLLYFFYNYLLAPLIQVALIVVFYKSGLGAMFRLWMERRKSHLPSFLFISMYPMMHVLVRESAQVEEGNYAVSLMFFLVLLMVASFEGREEMSRKQMEAQQVSLQQQTSYIETLEGLQQEMRRFRHDYKNMMSGMYLHAKEGDLESVQQFIQDMAEDFDLQVGGQIRRLTQLGNVHMLEVKGLLLGKIEECSKDGTEFGLEVLRPLEKTRMRATDLCRCLGILIDNAMDEVRGREHAWIHIMISCQEGYTTFRVKNKLYSQVDFHKIWQQGYSTRGTDRGIGLASYQNILGRYEEVFPFTAIQDGCFVQELKIQE